MSSSAPFGVLSESQDVAEKAEEFIQDKSDQHGHDDEKRVLNTQGSSTIQSSDEDDVVVHNLARALTQHSIRHPDGEYVNPFHGSDNPLLNPASGKFNTKAWIKSIISIQSRDPERYPERTAGIAYRNLSAYGFGEPTDYQKTFGNYPLEFGSLFRRIVGQRQRTKIQILEGFDGLVKSGEMLVVLGRPGR